MCQCVQNHLSVAAKHPSVFVSCFKMQRKYYDQRLNPGTDHRFIGYFSLRADSTEVKWTAWFRQIVAPRKSENS